MDKSLLNASLTLNNTQGKKSEGENRNGNGNLNMIETSSPKNYTNSKSNYNLEPNNVQTISIPIELDDHHEDENGDHDLKHKSNITPYILLAALSIHGLFEGIALGVQKHLKDAIFLGVAIIAHKWAESFTLGISFFKSNTKLVTFVTMIVLFTLFTPVGILFGAFVIGADPVTQGIFLAISSGTFLYISASEVIVDEFAITSFKYQKYFLYLVGGLLVGLLSFMEVLSGRQENN